MSWWRSTADLWIRHANSPIDLEVFEESGNLPHLESAGRFCQRLNGFLSGLPD